MKPYTAHINAADCMKDLAIDVRVKVHGLWRLWLGKVLLRAAAGVMGCRVNVSEPEGGIDE